MQGQVSRPALFVARSGIFPFMFDTSVAQRALAPLLIVLLTAVWLGGGVTADSTAVDESLQLLALPVLALAGWVHLRQGIQHGVQRAGILVALLVVAVPALQLLPLPMDGWLAADARRALAADLQVAGVQALHPHWSLAPAATEAALWSMLPALAAFLAALALPHGAMRRHVVKALLLLVAGNVAFAFFQAGLPHDSTLRLYQDFDAQFGGLFANTNHMATALIIGMVLAVGQAVRAWRRRAEGRSAVWAWLPYAGMAVCFLLLVPLSTSRAGMALALPALAATLLVTGAVPLRRLGRSKRITLIALAAALVAGVGMHTAMGWMAIDQLEELRHLLASAAVTMGKAHAPWGSGVGSFVAVFEQAAPKHLWLSRYVNHAHNEYAQWWLETGWLGMAVLAVVLGLLAVVGWQLFRLRRRGGHALLAGSCWVAIGVVLAHSWADFPLRTTSLMTVTATLAGLMLAALADARGQPGKSSSRRSRLPAAAAHRHNDGPAMTPDGSTRDGS